MPFPEGVFVCALPKSTLGSNLKWEVAPDKIAQVFSPHYIEAASIKFQNKRLAIRSPSLGDFRQHMMGIKAAMDRAKHPPFGIPQQE